MEAGLGDRHGHFFGRLCVVSGFSSRHDNRSCTGLLDGQCAGVGIHIDIVPAAVLQSVADRAVAVGCGADALVRVAIGGGHVFGCDCLRIFRRNRQRAVCIADVVIGPGACAGGNDVIGSCRIVIGGCISLVFLILQRRRSCQHIGADKSCDRIMRVQNRSTQVGHRAAYKDALILSRNRKRLRINCNGRSRLRINRCIRLILGCNRSGACFQNLNGRVCPIRRDLEYRSIAGAPSPGARSSSFVRHAAGQCEIRVAVCLC